MARPIKLNDLEKVKSVINEYKKDDKPTFVGLCRMLGVMPQALYAAMDRDDDIADAIKDGWTWLIYCWEKRLYSSQPTPAMFYLKTIRRFDFLWRDTPPPENITNIPEQTDNKLIIEVVSKNAKVEPITTAD